MDGIKISGIYKQLYIVICGIALLSLGIYACSSDQQKVVKTEQIEMYDLKEINGEYEQGAMSFAESFVYDEDGKKLDHRIRQPDNTLHREKYVYKDEQLIKSNYYSADSSLLSFYTYEYENAKLKKRLAYEAGSQELLRIDEYEYDADGRVTKQTIKTETGQVSRTMAFSYDQYGNEIQVTIRDDAGAIIVNEEFKITEYDVDKRWLERWSFNNDIPLTKRKRLLEYY